MPATPKKRQLTRDEGIQILAFRRLGMTYEAIAKLFSDISPRQVEHLVQKGHPTPQKRSGRPPFITDEQLQELTAFVCTSKRTRRLPWNRLPLEYPMCTWKNATESSITSAMRRAGFRRRIGRRKPPISEKNRQLRLAWAYEHLNWSREQWCTILWTDETWVQDGIHKRIFVSVRPGEELDPTCIVERRRSYTGWMFWSCFSGTTKG